MATYRTKPDASTRMPGGIPFIVGNELAERFSFYGMKGILTVYMTKHLVDSSGASATMTDEDAKAIYHLFAGAAYFMPLIGALLSDIFFGKYKTIIILSIGYCLGHLFLAMGDTGIGRGLMQPESWLYLGLIFIAIGAGGIKPCVSAHVGDQFGSGNKHLLTLVFNIFYFSINVGSFASTLLTPILLRDYGPEWAFGVPGILMAIATLLFWMGRNRFVHVPASGFEKFNRETFGPEGRRALINLAPIFLIFIPMFWAIFDQTGSAWVLQAQKMDRNFLGFEWLPSQIQAINPLFILILIPIFTFVLYPLVGKFVRVTPLRKIGFGLFITVIASGMTALIETQITGGDIPNRNLSSVSPAANWSGVNLIDGPVDGNGWSSAKISEGDPDDAEDDVAFPFDITVRLRDRAAWTVSSVELNPYALRGEPESSDPEALAEYEAVTGEAAKESWRLAEATPDWARGITVLVHDASVDEPAVDADGEPIFTEVATGELRKENALQPISFEAVQATHVRIRITSNHGGDRAKLGRLRVIADDLTAPADMPEKVAAFYPDVAALGHQPWIAWQFLAYVILTAAEVLVSIVSLEFAYTQAPKKMKSFIMGVYFMGVSFGNFFTSGVNFAIQNDDGTSKLEGASYYWFFTVLMLVVAVAFVVFSLFYKGATFIQGETDAAGELEHEQAEAEGTGQV